MGDVIIAEHALKHGIDESDIRYAWDNFLRKQYRGSPNEGEIIVVGYDRKGEFIELVAAERVFGTVIFHALKPPTTKVLQELGLKGKGMHR
ncbi:MAG: hypothetical protein IKE43_08035 [Coriobacteriales bacterium]|nr:hypothetical protein [Coriobacteriales bacterium]